MTAVKDLACSGVAPRVSGDTGQEKGGTQKSKKRVHSSCIVLLEGQESGAAAGNRTRATALEGLNPKPLDNGRQGLREDYQWKGRVIMIRPLLQMCLWSQGCQSCGFKPIARVNALDVLVEGWDHALIRAHSLTPMEHIGGRLGSGLDPDFIAIANGHISGRVASYLQQPQFIEWTNQWKAIIIYQ